MAALGWLAAPALVSKSWVQTARQFSVDVAFTLSKRFILFILSLSAKRFGETCKRRCW